MSSFILSSDYETSVDFKLVGIGRIVRKNVKLESTAKFIGFEVAVKLQM